MIDKLIKFIGFILPFELIVAYAAHNLFKPIFGEWYRLFFIGIIGIFIIYFILTNINIKRDSIIFLLVSLIFTAAGLWEYIVSLIVGGLPIEALMQFLCGFMFPALLFFTIINLSDKRQTLFFKSWYLGTIGLMLLGYIVTAYYYNNLPEWYRNKDIAFKLFSFRYAYGDNPNSNGMILILGNFNKASNYILIMLLLSVRLLSGKDGLMNTRLIKIFWVIGFITLVILFSRLAVLLLPFVYWASGVNKYFIGFFKRKLVMGALAILIGSIVVKNSELIKPTFDYLLFSKFDENSSDDGVLGTGAGRFSDWKRQSYRFSVIDNWIHGMGVGRYGLEEGSKDYGTHNLLFDHFLASGFFVPIVVILIWCIGLVKGVIKKRKEIIIGFIIIMALFFREYSLSYLFVTVHGGVIFMLLSFSAFKRRQDKEVVGELT